MCTAVLVAGAVQERLRCRGAGVPHHRVDLERPRVPDIGECPVPSPTKPLAEAATERNRPSPQCRLGYMLIGLAKTHLSAKTTHAQIDRRTMSSKCDAWKSCATRPHLSARTIKRRAEAEMFARGEAPRT